MRILSRQDAIDILYGCTLLGAGGGGSLLRGLDMINRDFDRGLTLRMISLEEIPDDAYIATPYGCGAPIDEAAGEDARFAALPHLEDSAAVLAFQRLEAYMGKKFHAVSSTELGGENTAEALHIAALLGLPLIDADPAGRAVPELQHSSYYIQGMPIDPLAVATNFGESIILEKVHDDFRAEEIIRAIAVASGNEVGVADHPMIGADYKRAIIPEMMSYAMQVGQIIRENRELKKAGGQAAQQIAALGHGRILFHGVVESMPWKTEGGFNIGEIHYTGIDEDEGSSYRIIIKNENMIGYRNDEPDIMIPDLLCMLTGDADVVTTPNFSIGTEMYLIGLPAPDIWRSDRGLSIFSPQAMGYDLEYKPLI